MLAAPLGDDGKEDLDTAYAELIGDDRIQTSFDTLPPPEPPPEWALRLGEWLAGLGDIFGPLFSWIPSSAGVGKPILIIVIVLLAALFLFFIGRWAIDRFGLRQPKSVDEEAIPDLRPDAGAAQSLLDQADALAREGKFAEAVHLLMFRSLEDIESKLPDFLRPALTGRDIAGAQALPDEPRSAFATIAQVVERGIFARRPVDEGGWQQARQAYQRFAFESRWT